MQSTSNNSNNYDASAHASDYEKNEYYTDFGLAKGQKKDSKSHSKKALEQSEERQNKLAEQVSQLPKKLQAKLQEVVLTPTATTKGKTKTALKTKPFYDRRNKASQVMLLDDYAEHCVAEDDALNEVHTEAVENMYHQEMERQEEEKEARYQAYLECKWKWDFPDDGMSQWELRCLQDEIQKYEAEFSANWEADSHYNDYERAREEEDESYQKGLELWLKYGLTKEQYDANRKYESNVKALNAFYQEPDYWNYPDYEMRLKAAIKKYEDDFDAQQKEQALKDEQNEWWKDFETEDYYDEEADQDYNFESYEDYCERRREEDMEAQRQDAIDDMYDHY
jgi:hypothetical protein